MCNGEAHGLLDLLIMPISSMVRNSALASLSLLGGKRQVCEWTGGPLVEMKCSTPCAVKGVEKCGRCEARKLRE